MKAATVATLPILGLGLMGAASPPPARVAVSAGPARLGSASGEDDERPSRSKHIPGFAIDRTEVTRGDYQRCVAARQCRALPAPPAGAAARAEGDDATLPVTGVSWNDARDFCRFAKGRLPREDEWEKAARGVDGRQYPWGDDAACARANWGTFDGEGPCAGKNPGRPVPVGSYPDGASPYGVLDMAGNVWEWVADRYDQDPSRRVVRGGSCCSYFVAPRAANRNAWAPDHRDVDLGFRCAARST